ncbi:4-mannosyltransferase) (GDP-Man:GlcNAc2-PP-dolichol mannosyltransferase) (GDP-mannose-dolichol diphosphochitobiose mannosyltransferase) [Durusdinium trenchii]|uniref:4-mannosyltransferase (GDP-Man:GlcNAc2-PP-dolichol mannosyltransferase (GDP-mannose-dolichol diphosphochitobiose mannosyltransferase n=1 Tax=Durusdinium trenchii TaxID=1381693 RepID=A0ABP0LTL9_9DINO
MADDAFCVTAQMRSRLASEWSVSATPLHDRPASMFRRCLWAETQNHIQVMGVESILRLSDWWPDGRSQTLFTEVSEGQVSRSSSRPHLVISSTSWTPDEDFNQLLDALPALDRDLAKAAKRAVVVVTGKGELRQQFEARELWSLQQLKAVRVLTLWLSFKDYALLLGSADLGLSLHTSSSGFDLPMKVVDMFGAGLPACARSFAALPELVRHGENGFTFSSSEELAQSLSHALGVGSPARGNLPVPPLDARSCRLPLATRRLRRTTCRSWSRLPGSSGLGETVCI